MEKYNARDENLLLIILYEAELALIASCPLETESHNWIIDWCSMLFHQRGKENLYEFSYS